MNDNDNENTLCLLVEPVVCTKVAIPNTHCITVYCIQALNQHPRINQTNLRSSRISPAPARRPLDALFMLLETMQQCWLAGIRMQRPEREVWIVRVGSAGRTLRSQCRLTGLLLRQP